MISRNKSKNTLKQMKMRTQNYIIYGNWESNPKKEVHSITGYLKKQEKVLINNLTSHLKELEKENKHSPK